MICTQCGAVDTEHYTYKTKMGPVPFAKCKKCHNIGTYTKKKTGWHKLDDARVVELRAALADRTKKVKHIASEFDIPATTLQYWIKKGITTEPAHHAELVAE